MQILVKDLSFVYSNGKSKLQVLNNLSFNIKKGEFIAIVGPSGCGKTTLLNCLSGILKPTSGKILVDKKLPKPGYKTGFVFQDHLLLPWRTIIRNITFGLELKGIKKEEARNKAREVLELLNLSDFENYYAHQLSGGMKQRVNLARALICDPEILLLDEPFAHLDAQIRELMQQELLKIFNKTKKTFILVTHQIDEAIFLADKLIILSKRPGEIKEIINIDIKRPRSLKVKNEKEFLKIKNHVWNIIQDEIFI